MCALGSSIFNTVIALRATIAEQLSECLIGITYDDFPSATVHQAKRSILDYLGATIRGVQTNPGKIGTTLAERFGGPSESTIVGSGKKVACSNAALANGIMGHAVQIDDGHRYAQAHPATAIMPAAVATGERQNSSGQDLIAATILGYEAFIRIGIAINPSHNDRGFHSTGTLGAFGSTVAAGILLRLDKKQMVDALGSAGSLASGLMEYISDGSMSKYLIPGNAAKNGVLAALLAQEGFTGPHLVFEGRKGFFRAASDKYDLTAVTKNLPKTVLGVSHQYKIMECYFKPYPVCGHITPTVDSIWKLTREKPVEQEDIAKVTIRTYALALDESDDPSPKTTTGATVSLQYAAAAALIHGRLTPDEFTERKLHDPKIRELMKRIEVTVDPELDKLAPAKRCSIVELTTKDGTTRSARVDSPKGEPESPLTDSEVKAKFYSLATPVLGRERCERIETTVNSLEDLSSVRDLGALFAP